MKPFVFKNPSTVLFGQGQMTQLSQLITKNQKVLLVYGGGSIKKNGVYDQITTTLTEHQVMEFSGVEPNPSVETLNKAVELVKQNNLDFILAVGGGSVIDGCKYIAAASLYEGDGWDILTSKHQIKDALSIGAVLTLPATGSETNAAAVVTQQSSQEKRAFIHPSVYPQFAILDPDVIKTLPERQLKNGLADAFVHVCEQYLTFPSHAMVQDAYAEGLLSTLITLGQQFDQRDNDDWRANLMFTANQALNGLIGSGVPQDWATHMIGHELTALYNIDHARTLTMIQPTLLRNQVLNKHEKLKQMGRNVFKLPNSIDLAERTIDSIEAFYNSLDLPTRISDVVQQTETSIPDILEKLKQHKMTALGEHQQITLDVSRAILEKAWNS